jgi:Mrp family chromosome partitioning ATPase
LSNCDTCPSKSNCNSQEECLIENNPYNQVKHVIAVMSGKGGVGKSTISALIAKDLNRQGYRVGVLDADVTGPSIPRLLGIQQRKVEGCEFGIIPAKSEDGIKVMSLNLLIDDEEKPVIWRGPIISGTVKQFWTDVFWGDLDFLLIDMPPGTGDVALTVMQSIPISGMVMVSTPQEMVSMIVAKAVNMAKTMEVPVIGIVENMSYIKCPDCQKRIRMFDDDNLQDYLDRMDLDLLGELPMTREIADISQGKFEASGDDVAEALAQITSKIIAFCDERA